MTSRTSQAVTLQMTVRALSLLVFALMLTGCAGASPRLSAAEVDRLPLCSEEPVAVSEQMLVARSAEAVRDSLARAVGIGPQAEIVPVTTAPDFRSRTQFIQTLTRVYPSHLRDRGTGDTHV